MSAEVRGQLSGVTSLSLRWVPGLQPRPSGWLTSINTCYAISPASPRSALETLALREGQECTVEAGVRHQVLDISSTGAEGGLSFVDLTSCLSLCTTSNTTGVCQSPCLPRQGHSLYLELGWDSGLHGCSELSPHSSLVNF